MNSVFVWVSRLVVQVSKRWEGSSSKPVKLVSKNLNLFSLLLGNIKEFTLVSDFLDLFGWVSITIIHGVGLQAHNLLTLVNIVLKVTSCCLKLFTLHLLLLDFFLELESSLIDGPDSLLGVLFELLDLIFKSLLVLFIFLLMLTLDDFLGLLSDSVELDILSSLLEIFNFQIESLLDISNPLETSFELTDRLHELNLFVTSSIDFLIFVVNHIL